jgi:sugar porter (SP) family MFS transporter
MTREDSLLDAKSLLNEAESFNDGDFTSRQRFTPYLASVILITVLCPLQFGWNIGVVNTPEEIITHCDAPSTLAFLHLPSCIGMSKLVWGAVVAAFPLGGLFGGFMGAHICKSIGRRNTLFYNNFVFIVASLLMALAYTPAMLIGGRFIVGLGAGMGTAVAPMYLAEIPPIRYRGAIGALHQLAVVIGILLSQALGLVLSTSVGWRLLFGFSVLPSVLQILALPLCVESPRYLVLSGHADKARTALKKLRNQTEVEDELEYLVACHERDQAQNAQALTLAELVRRKSLRRALIIAIVAQLSQQLSGINGVMQFSTAIFKQIIGEANGALMTFIVGLVNLFMTLISVALMDKAGRRVLFLLSQFGMALVSALITLSAVYHFDAVTVTCVIAFVALFAIGLGPIPWLIMPEIFPTYAIASAASVGVTLNWVSNVAVSYAFEPVYELIGAWTFLIFAVFSFILGVIMYIILPETKGKSIDEVAETLAE